MVSIRVSSDLGACQIQTTILFRAAALGGVGFLDNLESNLRVVGCKGVHLLVAGLFKRHNPVRGAERSIQTQSDGVFDPFGYQSIRPTSYSIHAHVPAPAPAPAKVGKGGGAPPRPNPDLGVSPSPQVHCNANGTSPGPSVLKIAGEILNIHLEDTALTRVSEPIPRGKWKDISRYQKSVVLGQNPKGAAAGLTAIAAASTIVELISAEAFVSMRANPFFDGAMPDRFLGPHGIAISVAISVRLALHWEKYSLARPSACDGAANEQLRLIFETGRFGPLSSLCDFGPLWCIDVALHSALGGAAPPRNPDLGVSPSPQVGDSPSPTSFEDQKFFWQRVGQRLITATFGLGSVPKVSSDRRFGVPSNLENTLQTVRDAHLESNGCLAEGLDTPVIELASIGRRRTALIELLFGVESYMRDGGFEGSQLAPSDAELTVEVRLERSKIVVHETIVSKAVDDLARRACGTPAERSRAPYEDRIAAKVLKEINTTAMGSSINDIKDLLLCGSVTHFKYMIGSYVVSPTQTSPCTDCEAPVHVLEGTMMANSYSACTACNAKRCLNCAEIYARSICITTPQRVGRRCRRCGADAAFVDVKVIENADGSETSMVHLGTRTARFAAGNLCSVDLNSEQYEMGFV